MSAPQDTQNMKSRPTGTNNMAFFGVQFTQEQLIVIAAMLLAGYIIIKQ